MKRIRVSEDIVPIGEFKAHASRLLREIRSSNRAVVITQNGKPAGVLITPEEFDRLRERERFLTAIRAGDADVQAGRITRDEDIGRELDERFGKLR